MDSFMFVEWIHQYGYVALFLSFYVSLIGLPVPNEVLVMTGGLLSAKTSLHPFHTFLVIYGTVILNATILYVIGRTWGNRLLKKLYTFEKLTPPLTKATSIVQKYGAYAAAFCYLLPFVRHFIPFVVGVHCFSYSSFARYSYITAFFWTLTLFLLGNQFGDHIDLISAHLDEAGLGFILLLLLFGMVLMLRKRMAEARNHS